MCECCTRVGVKIFIFMYVISDITGLLILFYHFGLYTSNEIVVPDAPPFRCFPNRKYENNHVAPILHSV